MNRKEGSMKPMQEERLVVKMKPSNYQPSKPARKGPFPISPCVPVPIGELVRQVGISDPVKKPSVNSPIKRAKP